MLHLNSIGLSGESKELLSEGEIYYEGVSLWTRTILSLTCEVSFSVSRECTVTPQDIAGISDSIKSIFPDSVSYWDPNSYEFIVIVPYLIQSPLELHNHFNSTVRGEEGIPGLKTFQWTGYWNSSNIDSKGRGIAILVAVRLSPSRRSHYSDRKDHEPMGITWNSDEGFRFLWWEGYGGYCFKESLLVEGDLWSRSLIGAHEIGFRRGDTRSLETDEKIMDALESLFKEHGHDLIMMRGDNYLTRNSYLISPGWSPNMLEEWLPHRIPPTSGPFILLGRLNGHTIWSYLLNWDPNVGITFTRTLIPLQEF